jgi:hypothetical protein
MRLLVGSEKPNPGVTRKRNPERTRGRLRQIREEIIAEGTRLLTLQEIRDEVAERRGGRRTYSAKHR